MSTTQQSLEVAQQQSLDGETLGDCIFNMGVALNRFNAETAHLSPKVPSFTRAELSYLLTLLLQQSIQLRKVDQFDESGICNTVLTKVNDMVTL